MKINFEEIQGVDLHEFNGGKGTTHGKLLINDDGKVFRATLTKGTSIGVHTHENSAELVYIISGTATFTIDGEKEEVRAGECHYCPLGHTHTVVNEQDEDLVMFCVVVNGK